MIKLLRNILSWVRFEPESLSQTMPRVYLPEQVVQDTVSFILCGDEEKSHESIVYWAGVAMDEKWIIMTVIAPEATTTAGSFKTATVANALVVAEANKFHLWVLAQVHSHPSGWVGHSAGDNVGAFMPFEGFYSIVVPRYGLQGMLPITTCGIHRFEQGNFVRMSNDDIEQQFVVLPSNIDLRHGVWETD